MNMSKNILLVMAMLDEASPIIKEHSFQHMGKLKEPFTLEHYLGKIHNTRVNLLVNGKCNVHGIDQIGTQVSTLSTYLGAEMFKPTIIINAGTAGGFLSDNAKIGDTYLGYPNVYYHDRRINLPGFKEYGFGCYPTFDCRAMASELGLRLGIITTGNSLDFTEKDMELIKHNQGVVKDMEAASIAWVANQFGIPYVGIKTITDIVDGSTPTEEEFILNLKLASHNLAEKTTEVISWLAAHGY